MRKNKASSGYVIGVLSGCFFFVENLLIRRNTVKGVLQVALLVLTTAVMPLANAQPNMVGVWVQEGVGVGARVGSTDSGNYTSKDEKSREYVQSHMRWRLEVTDQKGRAFHAKWCSEKSCETAVGAFRGNGDLLMVDEDGLFIGSVEAGKLELCYLEAGESHQTVNCRDFIKKK